MQSDQLITGIKVSQEFTRMFKILQLLIVGGPLSLFVTLISVQKEDIRGMKRAMKKTPNFKQGTKETDAAFMSRVELTSQRVIAASQFQDKYKVKKKITMPVTFLLFIAHGHIYPVVGSIIN